MNYQPHHYVIDGISLAYNGLLPTHFVVPTLNSIADGSAQSYGWKETDLRLSGRLASEMPASRKVQTFGDIDIEGDQVFFGRMIAGDASKFTDDSSMVREAFSNPEDRINLTKCIPVGCFGRNFIEEDVPHISLAILPAKYQTFTQWVFNYGNLVANELVPCEYREAESHGRQGKWKTFIGYFLQDPEYIPTDNLYKC